MQTEQTERVTVLPVWETWEAGGSSRGWRGMRVTRRNGTRTVVRRVGAVVPSVDIMHLLRVREVLVVRGENGLLADGRGIDLVKRGHEVRKLFYAAFARGLVRDGFDPEEALQEVFKGLLARNKGTCPFDVKKSSFGHYVHIVTGCVLANYVRKERKHTHYEVSEGVVTSWGGGESSREWEVPVAATQENSLRGREYLRAHIEAHLSGVVNRAGLLHALDLLAQGYSRRESAEASGVEYKQLTQVLAGLRGRLSGVVSA